LIICRARRRPPHTPPGLWGDDDEYGTLNLLTPSAACTRALPHRPDIRPQWNLEMPSPPLWGARSCAQIQGQGDFRRDDVYDNFNTVIQSVDGLTHVGSKRINALQMGAIEATHGARTRTHAVWARRGIAVAACSSPTGVGPRAGIQYSRASP